MLAFPTASGSAPTAASGASRKRRSPVNFPGHSLNTFRRRATLLIAALSTTGALTAQALTSLASAPSPGPDDISQLSTTGNVARPDAVCAGILAAVLGLVASQEVVDANPAQSVHRGRQKHTFKTRKPGRELGTADWPSAAERAARLPDGSGRQSELQKAVIDWVNVDTQAAVENLLSQSRRTDPVAARDWQPGS